MLDIGMIGLFILLTAIMIGLAAWSGNVFEEGRGEK